MRFELSLVCILATSWHHVAAAVDVPEGVPEKFSAAYVGCFKDQRDRDLPESLGRGFSIADCMQRCKDRGFPFAGLQWYDYCFCGEEHTDETATCDRTCKKGEGICGGGWANSIYRTDVVESGAPTSFEAELEEVPDLFKSVYEGCFKDQKPRDLPVELGRPFNIAQCVQRCEDLGHPLAGLQYYDYCFCGEEHTDKLATCNTACRDGGGVCGGGWANSVFRTGEVETGVKSSFEIELESVPEQFKSVYEGCFKDQSDRDLPFSLGRQYSIAECLQRCGEHGYDFAGLQYYDYCFCGNEYTDTLATCNTPCRKGDGFCGGGWANSVYRTGEVETGVKTIFEMELETVPEKFKSVYEGCFKDQSDRELPFQLGRGFSMADCIQRCEDHGYPLAGLQWYDYCFCGEEHTETPAKCDRPCKIGEGICGGGWANSVFRTGEVETGAKTLRDIELEGVPDEFESVYEGCFKDQRDRDLPYSLGRGYSIAECMQRCDDHGYNFAGLQWYDYCFCGNSHTSETSKCSTACKRGEGICGGGWANSIYRTGEVETGIKTAFEVELEQQPEKFRSVYEGCFKDQADRDLPDQLGRGFSIAECLQKCEDRGHAYAALQYYDFCFCGDEYTDTRALCNTACKKGDGICGGGWANSVFRTGEVETGVKSAREIELEGVPDEFEPAYEGCFKDQKDRDLPFQLGRQYSIPECLQRCHDHGYAFAGLQWYDYCFCGNKHTETKATCDRNCNKGEGVCGGGYANSVYRTGEIETGVKSLRELELEGVPDNFEPAYEGCFKDQHDRDLPDSHGTGYSIAECLQLCEDRGFAFAGLQWYGYCFCGDKHTETTAVCDRECNKGEGICGGGWANSVYRTGEVETGVPTQEELELLGVPDEFEPAYQGCFKDQRDRDLPHLMGTGYSIPQCMQICEDAKYAYAGLQYYSYCFCGNEHTDVSAVCNTECTSGDGVCGGGWANSIYKTGVVETGIEPAKFSEDYVGCYKDQPDRDLPLNLGSGHTIEECVTLCGKYNYIYAGLQYYSYCFCGDEHTDVTATCNTPCKEGGGICGGGWANSVYETGSEGGPKLAHTEYLGECAGAVGSWWGDPHVISWDDRKWDCQGESEFVLVRSGDFEVQGRFEGTPSGNWVTVTTAMAIKNGDLPVVQLSIVDAPTDKTWSIVGCPVEIHVDGVLQDPQNVLAGGISVTPQTHKIAIQYPDAGPAFDVGFHGPLTAWHGCTMDTKICIPTEMTAAAIGLLGTPDGNRDNDFMDEYGHELDINPSGRGGFEYCTTHWCVRDEADSYFTYPEGKNFSSFENCGAEPPKKEVTYDLPQETIDRCQGSEACLVEAQAAQDAGENPDTAAEEAIENVLEVDDTRGNDDPKRPGGEVKTTAGCEGEMPSNGGDYCPHDVGVQVLGVSGVDPTDLDESILYDIEPETGNDVSFKVSNPFHVDMKIYTSYVKSGEIWSYHCEEADVPACGGADESEAFTAQCMEKTGFAVVRVYFVEQEATSKRIFGGAELEECCHPDEADSQKPIAEYVFQIQCDCPSDGETETSRRLMGRL